MPSKAHFDFTALLRSRSDLAGTWSSVFLGQGGDISHIRPYQPGDRLRHIHRPSFFRGELMTKEFFGERRMAIRLMFDATYSTMPIKGFEPITAKAAKDAMELFSDLIQGAADFWGIPVSKTKVSMDSRLRLPRENVSRTRGSLIFLASDFYEGPEAYNAFFRLCGNTGMDLIPVLINTSWIWRELQKSNMEISGIDVGRGMEEGTVSTGEKTLFQKEAALKEREDLLRRLFKRQNLSWINLKKPEFSSYVREMTRCFSEKYRANA